MKPSLSIVLPVYNAAATLPATMTHVLEVAAEAEDRFEVLILDNGSIDDTYDTAWEQARLYRQVLVARVSSRCGFGRLMTLARTRANADWLCVHSGIGRIIAAEIVPLWQSHNARRPNQRSRPSAGIETPLTWMESFDLWSQRQRARRPFSGHPTGFQILPRTGLARAPAMLDSSGQAAMMDHIGQTVRSPHRRRRLLKEAACHLRNE